MSCNVVFDTNVLVSALLSSNEAAPPVQLLVKALSGDIVPVFSPEIISEYQDVLLRPKFAFPPDVVRYLLGAVAKYGLEVQTQPIDWLLSDIKDMPFYAAAIAKPDLSCWLVTGNLKHFPVEKFVVSPRRLLDILTLN